MNYHGDLRNRRSQFGTTQYSITNFYTDTPKTEMKNAFGEDIFHKLHLIPEPLKKNLADTLPTAQKEVTAAYEPPAAPTMGAEYSRLSGIASFISGMVSALSDAVFRRARSTDQVWQHANDEYKNGLDPAGEANVAMSECKTAAAACEGKLLRVRQLLANKPGTNRYLARPRKTFVEPSLVEEHFEDAFSPEDFVRLASNTIIEYVSPLQYEEQKFFEVDAPKTKVELSPDMQQSSAAAEEQQSHEVGDKNPTLVVSSCEDKLSKLKALLQSKKSARTKEVLPETPPLDPDPPAVPSKPSKSIPNAQPKDKRFKNPNRLCVDKRQKTRMKQVIEEDMMFADDIQFDELSLENSPSFHSLEGKINEPVSDSPDISEVPIGPQEYITDNSEPACETPQLCVDRISEQLDTPQEYFDEISGRFRSTSASSDDSFQIVFTDIPQRVRNTSECDSEDSFIVFEESPNSCYTSNDVFGDSDSDSDSDSDGECDIRMPQTLSRTVSNLADDSLYDEVDCARSVAPESTGLLLDDRKKALRKNQPPKKVRFSEAAPRVHVMRVWALAARLARPGHWERCARDRERFQRRIADVDMAVSWVLKPQHRARVMFQRVRPWWNRQRREEEERRRLEEERARECGGRGGDTQHHTGGDDGGIHGERVGNSEVSSQVVGELVNGDVSGEDDAGVDGESVSSPEVNIEVVGKLVNGDISGVEGETVDTHEVNSQNVGDLFNGDISGDDDERTDGEAIDIHKVNKINGEINGHVNGEVDNGDVTEFRADNTQVVPCKAGGMPASLACDARHNGVINDTLAVCGGM